MALNCELEIDAGDVSHYYDELEGFDGFFRCRLHNGWGVTWFVFGIRSGFVRDSFGMQSYNIRNWQLGGCMVLYAILWITGGTGKGLV